MIPEHKKGLVLYKNPKGKNVVRIMRTFRLKKSEDGPGPRTRYVIEHSINYDGKKQRVGLRGMWYGNNPLNDASFGKVEMQGLLPMGKTGRHMPAWQQRKFQ